MGAGGGRCVSRPHIGPICHCCLLDPALHFSAMILLPFFVPEAATQSPSPFKIVISSARTPITNDAKAAAATTRLMPAVLGF